MATRERTHLMFSAKEGTVSELAPTSYATRDDCRICHSKSLEPVLDLGDQFLPRFVPEPDFSLPRAPLELVRCESCGLLQLRHTVHSDLLFRRYWYRSSVNDTMRRALEDVVDHATQYHKRGKWLDIGANDGYLLSQVEGFHKTAVEPAQDFAGLLHQQAQVVVPDYFSADKLNDKYDVVTSAACFYDVDDPGKFVADVAKVLTEEGVWVNQLNDAPTMLKKNAFDSICHEHLAYYDVPTLDRLYREHGLNITRVTFNDVNGGSVRVIARKTSRSREDMLGIPKTKPEEVREFARRVAKWKATMLDLCQETLSFGGAYCYGASTKGTVLLQYLGVEGVFKGVAERNQLKHGLKMVGSWLPIVSEEEMRDAKPRWLLCLPWGLAKEEFLRRERELMQGDTIFIMPLPNIELIT